MHHSELASFNVIVEKRYGLSLSRNIGIENSSSDFIWFLDDDVYLFDYSIDKIKDHLKEIHHLTYILLEWNAMIIHHIKNIQIRLDLVDLILLKFLRRIDCFKKFIKEHNVRFNENLGLGSNYPQLKRIFFSRCFDKGGLVSHYPEFLIKHEYINRKAIHFKDEFILKAKGAFCRRYGGLVGFMILGYYSLKCLFISKNFLIMLNLFFGYVNAQTIIGFDDE